MTKTEATAEVFVTAFRALSRKERDAVVVKLIEDDELRQDLFDIALAQERVKEPTRPLKSILKDIKSLKTA